MIHWFYMTTCMFLLCEQHYCYCDCHNMYSKCLLAHYVLSNGGYSVLSEKESCEEELCFVRRFLSLVDLEMEDIDIPIATHCVPGQQGVKQPIK